MNKINLKTLSLKLSLFIYNTFRNPVFIFFLIYLLIGTLVFRTYGISWDEPYQRQIGYVNLEYIRGDQSLLNFTDRFYGPAFELPLVIIERVFKIQDTQTIYYMRHYLTFLLFFFTTIIFYFLNKRIYKSRGLALTACLLLILSPRIFADSFYNSKDIPLLALYTISTFTMLNYLENKKRSSLVFHIVASALVVTTRVIGGIIPVITVFTHLITKTKDRQSLKRLVTYILGTTITTYTLWPVLWTNPLRIFDAIKTMANFSYQDNLPTLYFGKYISTFELPWHYLPVWIGITIPISFMFLFLFGLYRTAREIIKSKGHKKTTQLTRNIILLSLIFIPVLSAVFLGSTLYDGWRHFYFIYPLMVIFMVKGIIKLPKVIITLIIIELLFVISFMVKVRPYQHLYFNSFLSNNMKKTKQQFEMDYWGLSYREALQYIVDTDNSESIQVVVANNPGNSNALILNKEDRDRIHFLNTDDIDDAEYYISNYRWHPSEYGYKNQVFARTIDGAKIIVVYKL